LKSLACRTLSSTNQSSLPPALTRIRRVTRHCLASPCILVPLCAPLCCSHTRILHGVLSCVHTVTHRRQTAKPQTQGQQTQGQQTQGQQKIVPLGPTNGAPTDSCRQWGIRMLATTRGQGVKNTEQQRSNRKPVNVTARHWVSEPRIVPTQSSSTVKEKQSQSPLSLQARHMNSHPRVGNERGATPHCKRGTHNRRTHGFRFSNLWRHQYHRRVGKFLFLSADTCTFVRPTGHLATRQRRCGIALTRGDTCSLTRSRWRYV
jgi:hypothetical protein